MVQKKYKMDKKQSIEMFNLTHMPYTRRAIVIVNAINAIKERSLLYSNRERGALKARPHQGKIPT